MIQTWFTVAPDEVLEGSEGHGGRGVGGRCGHRSRSLKGVGVVPVLTPSVLPSHCVAVVAEMELSSDRVWEMEAKGATQRRGRSGDSSGREHTFARMWISIL